MRQAQNDVYGKAETKKLKAPEFVYYPPMLRMPDLCVFADILYFVF